MNTLIFNGSPRENGDTAHLIREIERGLAGEVHIVNAYRSDVSACVDCRYCREHEGCAIDDGMREIYRRIQECDNILIASPLYFSELTGRLLDVGSRLQTYFSARRFRGEEPIPKPKRGAILLVGGGTGDPNRACATARVLLRAMNCREIHEAVCIHNTDAIPAIEDANARPGLENIVNFFWGGNAAASSGGDSESSPPAEKSASTKNTAP